MNEEAPVPSPDTVKVVMPEGVTSVAVEGKEVLANAEGHFEMELKHALQMVESFGASIWRKVVPQRTTASLRTDGPTLEEFLAAGYLAEHYPPSGYAVRVATPAVDPTPEELAAKEAADKAAAAGTTS